MPKRDREAKRVRKPRPLYRGQSPIAWIADTGRVWFGCISLPQDAKFLARLAAWLTRAAAWIEQQETKP